VGLAACFIALAACSGSAPSYSKVENPSVRSPEPLAPPVEASNDGRDGVLATVPNAGPLPAPEPLFGSMATVSYRAFVEEVRRVADELASAPEVERSYHSFLADYQLAPSDVSIESYSRVRLVFEATRDGGLWGVKWTITDRMPWSDAIWEQWRAFDGAAVEPDVTAVAECDELSALFAFLARDVGVQGFVGLFWPAWNHAVAVWELRRGATPKDPGTRVRVMVPTSQIWLSRQATLGSREFETNRAVFPYARNDLKPESELSVPLARFLIERLERYGGLSNEALLERRNRLGGS
jgi:hypothetical protein